MGWRILKQGGCGRQDSVRQQGDIANRKSTQKILYLHPDNLCNLVIWFVG
jgi:hypothetical protein